MWTNGIEESGGRGEPRPLTEIDRRHDRDPPALQLGERCLGLGVSGIERQVWFHRPQLPSFLPEVRITDLSVAGATVDLLLVRHGDDVGVNVSRRVGDLSVVVAK